ncbi:MAG: histidinol dehydrogenase [Dehalococcoidia bacterium]|nr:histidinol dehydrogenase [Dehalococcoidia bacterium]
MNIYQDSVEVRNRLFTRSSWEDVKLSPALQKGVEDIFGKSLTAAEVVQRIVNDVRSRGDDAVREYSKKIDKVEVTNLKVGRREMYTGFRNIGKDLREALDFAACRIALFHNWQMEHAQKSFMIKGLGQKVTPMERVGIYVPGGTATYPSTVLMTAIPARVAGVKEVIVATPPGRDGQVSPAVLAAAYISGVDVIYKAGGAQAVAAMAFGTSSIPGVDKICGPGNIFVVLAKKMVYGHTAIDGLAGPTETIILADDTANPAACAADLLAQAEHDVMASAILITPSPDLARRVTGEVDRQVRQLGRGKIASESLDLRGGIVVVKSINEGIDIINSYAPEHVSLMVKSPGRWMNKIVNAGCIFVGSASAEGFGDYAAGPSHVLPTGGSARFSSALGVSEFLKITGIVKLDKKTAREIAPASIKIADAEGLTAHASAVRLRLEEKF